MVDVWGTSIYSSWQPLLFHQLHLQNLHADLQCEYLTLQVYCNIFDEIIDEGNESSLRIKEQLSDTLRKCNYSCLHPSIPPHSGAPLIYLWQSKKVKDIMMAISAYEFCLLFFSLPLSQVELWPWFQNQSWKANHYFSQCSPDLSPTAGRMLMFSLKLSASAMEHALEWLHQSPSSLDAKSIIENWYDSLVRGNSSRSKTNYSLVVSRKYAHVDDIRGEHTKYSVNTENKFSKRLLL